MTRALPALLGALAALALLHVLGWGPRSAPRYPDTFVPAERIHQVERVDTVVTFRERIVYRTAKPEQAATAPKGAHPDVVTFCADAVARAVAEAKGEDAPQETPPTLLLRSIRTEAGWFLAPDKLVLTGPLSNTDLRQYTYTARPGWQARVHGDSVIVQSPRWGVLRGVAEAAVYGAIGYGIGRLTR